MGVRLAISSLRIRCSCRLLMCLASCIVSASCRSAPDVHPGPAAGGFREIDEATVGSVRTAEYPCAGKPVLAHGFENGVESWELLPSDSVIYDEKTIHYGDLSVVDEGARSGASALRIAKAGMLQSPMIPYDGERLQFEFWMKLDGVTQGPKHWNRAGGQVQIFDGNGKPLPVHWGHYDCALETGTTGWVYYGRRLVLPPEVKAIRACCMMWNCEGGTAHFDDVRLVYYDEDAPLAPARLGIRADAAGRPLRKFWPGIDASHCERVAHDEYQRVIDKLAPLGFRYLRLHTPFTCIEVSVDEAGKIKCDWSRLDGIIRSILAAGLKPMVVTESMPEALASAPRTGWNYTCPPKDYAQWWRFVHMTVRHFQEEFGAGEVRSWPFEVWNEPGASGYFSGSHEEYLELYDYTVDAIKAADAGVQVGGPDPASRELFAVWTRHVSEGKNYLTGTVGSPVDFVSRHFYAGSGYREPFPEVRRNVEELRFTKAETSKYPKLKDLPLYITEWNCSTSGRPHTDNSYAAAFVCRCIKALRAEGGIDALYFFSFVDHIYRDNHAYEGDLGMFTAAGIAKPYYPTFQALSMLGETELPVTGGDGFTDALATRDSDGRVSVLVWHTSDDYEEPPTPARQVSIDLSGLKPGRYVLREYRIDSTHSNNIPDWIAAGKPQKPSPDLVKRLNDKAELEKLSEKELTIRDCECVISAELPMFSVSLFVLDRR